MNNNETNIAANNKRLYGILIGIGALLSIPLIAMQFTSEVNWSSSDFVIMGFLLITVGLACELVLRTVKTRKNRMLICAAVLLAFFLFWAELAVGVFGTPFAGN